MDIKIAATDKEMKQAYSIRQKVFVEEQNIPLEEEIDEHDKDATHFLVYDEKTAIGTCRCRIINLKTLKIERVCVLKPFRKLGAGQLLMKHIDYFARAKKLSTLSLNAQVRAKKFYENLGYIVISGEFLDSGIPHILMQKNLLYDK